jgi:hypothetical protein
MIKLVYDEVKKLDMDEIENNERFIFFSMVYPS